MKSLHRTKTLAAYEGARLVLKEGMTYPAYMLLKEAARGVLSYLAEDVMQQDINEKTKLSRLLELIDVENFKEADIKNIEKLIEAENKGLNAILTMDVDQLKEIKASVKSLIATHLKEPV
ncbi:MAG: hypothetical protein IKM15_04980 [Peptococcaceae bacterium]|nr:hypothetical protein [Peptococcaceae bacterium]